MKKFKPFNVNEITAQDTAPQYKIAPNPNQRKAGWQKEANGMTKDTDGKPPVEFMNYIQNNIEEGLAYLYREGVAEWDSTKTNYNKNDIIKHNGLLYRCTHNLGVPVLTPETDKNGEDWELLTITPTDLHKRITTPETNGEKAGLVKVVNTLQRDKANEDYNNYTVLNNKAIDDLRTELLRAKMIPIGSIMLLNKANADISFIPCDGREFNPDTYPELFKLLGNINRTPIKKYAQEVGSICYTIATPPTGSTLTEAKGIRINLTTDQHSPLLARTLIRNDSFNTERNIINIPNLTGRYLTTAETANQVGRELEDAVQSFASSETILNNVQALGNDVPWRGVSNQTEAIYQTLSWRDKPEADRAYLGRAYNKREPEAGERQAYYDSHSSDWDRTQCAYKSTDLERVINYNNAKFNLRSADVTRPKTTELLSFINTGNEHDDRYAYYIKASDYVDPIAEPDALDLQRLIQDNISRIDALQAEVNTKTTTAQLDEVKTTLQALIPSHTLEEPEGELYAGKGVLKIPTGGGRFMLIQYGSFKVEWTNTKYTEAYPVAFPNRCVSIIASTSIQDHNIKPLEPRGKLWASVTPLTEVGDASYSREEIKVILSDLSYEYQNAYRGRKLINYIAIGY